MIEIIFSILKNKTAVYILLALTAIAAVGGIIGWQTHKRHQAEREAVRQKEEKERLDRQNEGLKIIVNSANTAAEVEKLQEKANAQSQNSNLSNADFFNSRRRDSSEFSGNQTESRKRFCKNFPEDSRCR